MVLGDNSTCEVLGVGTVKLKTKEGGVRTLTNVKHVPTMKKNFVSLGYLERQGYTFAVQAETGVLKIGSHDCLSPAPTLNNPRGD